MNNPAVSSVSLRTLDAVRRGDFADADAALRPSLERLVESRITRLRFTSDEYSLNSVTGFILLQGGIERFFKLHVEDGEEDNVGEYYQAQLLAAAGLPVEEPIASNPTPGEQVVVYEVRREPRLVDVCLDAEKENLHEALFPEPWLAARHTLDDTIGRVLVATMKGPRPSSAGAAIHQLFHHRLAGPDGTTTQSRFATFYTGSGLWGQLEGKQWCIGGRRYRQNLAEIVAEALDLLRPDALTTLPVVTAHGDDHNGNIWCRSNADSTWLSLFDPAFAGNDIPALLALIKPTFHNVFAHPFWLYHPQLARGGTAEIEANSVKIPVPFTLSPLRQGTLDSIVKRAWIPLCTEMAVRGQLPANWRRIVRLGLALCPLLVTNLVASTRSRELQTISLAHVAAVAQEPEGAPDVLTLALDEIDYAARRAVDRANS